ncbi:MAG: TrkA C-terminal domain-containing protein [Acidimicrobiales bacterium]
MNVVLDLLTSTPQIWAAVINDERKVVGTISISDIVLSYQRTTRAYLQHLSEVGGASDVADVIIEEGASIAGVAIRSPLVPRGVLITSIERGKDVIRPSGDTVLAVGDRLTVLGAPNDISRLVQHASAQVLDASLVQRRNNP